MLLISPLHWLVATAVSPRGKLQSADLRLWPSAVDPSNVTRPLQALPLPVIDVPWHIAMGGDLAAFATGVASLVGEPRHSRVAAAR